MSLTEAQKQLKKAQQENLKAAFETLWRQLEGPELVPEYKFHAHRDWRFDYVAKYPYLIAIELEGGTFNGGAHVRGKGYSKDCQKYNTAQVLGWKVFRLTTDMINGADPAGHLEPIIKLCRAETPAAGPQAGEA